MSRLHGVVGCCRRPGALTGSRAHGIGSLLHSGTPGTERIERPLTGATGAVGRVLLVLGSLGQLRDESGIGQLLQVTAGLASAWSRRPRTIR